MFASWREIHSTGQQNKSCLARSRMSGLAIFGNASPLQYTVLYCAMISYYILSFSFVYAHVHVKLISTTTQKDVQTHSSTLYTSIILKIFLSTFAYPKLVMNLSSVHFGWCDWSVAMAGPHCETIQSVVCIIKWAFGNRQEGSHSNYYCFCSTHILISLWTPLQTVTLTRLTPATRHVSQMVPNTGHELYLQYARPVHLLLSTIPIHLCCRSPIIYTERNSTATYMYVILCSA